MLDIPKETLDAIHHRYGNNLQAFFEDAYKAAKKRAALLEKNPNYEREHERLKQAVVEAAQKWNELVGIPSTALELAGCALAEAVDRLNKYEAEMNSEV